MLISFLQLCEWKCDVCIYNEYTDRWMMNEEDIQEKWEELKSTQLMWNVSIDWDNWGTDWHNKHVQQ